MTKSNNVSNTTTLPNPWNWTLSVANSGNGAASFASGQTILTDSLPNGTLTYGLASVINPVGITGTISCGIASNTLTCTASGAVSIAAPGSFQVQFSVTPSAIGTFTNPTGGPCRVDPGAVVSESNESNNDCNSNAVTVTAPDLTAVKNNNVGGSVTFPNPWTWTIHVANGGGAAASFANTQIILTDNLPNSGVTYGSPSVANPSGVTGTIACSIVSNNLNCTASGAVSIAAPGSFDVQFTATPTVAGTFANPRAGGVCAVDPGDVILESNNANNSCSDSVNTVAADLQLSKAITAGVTSGTANTGSNVTYRVTVTNAGPSAAIGVTVTDTLPANVTLVSCTPSVGTCTGTTASLGTLANGTSATVTIVVKLNCDVADGTLIGANSASVSSSTPDPTPGNNSGSSATFTAKNPKPIITPTVTLSSLSFNTHNLLNVGLAATASDGGCPAPTNFTVQVFGDEDDQTPTDGATFSPDARDIGIGTLRLRAERVDSGDGRVYLVVVSATDSGGATGFGSTTVVVPKSNSAADRSSVSAQAAAAKAFADANNGTPPPGYFVIGDGPVIGNKQ